jgi:hypothetical protein
MADGHFDIHDMMSQEEEEEDIEIILPEILFSNELKEFLKLRKKLIKQRTKKCRKLKYRRSMKPYHNFSMLLFLVY